MPDPLAHSLMGYCYYQAVKPSAEKKTDFKTLSIFILFSSVPDLHYLPEILIGKLHRFQYNFIHSFGFMFAVPMVLYAVLEFTGNKKSFFWSANCFFLFLFHLFLDYYASTGSIPQG